MFVPTSKISYCVPSMIRARVAGFFALHGMESANIGVCGGRDTVAYTRWAHWRLVYRQPVPWHRSHRRSFLRPDSPHRTHRFQSFGFMVSA
jgi:hypothetical protein